MHQYSNRDTPDLKNTTKSELAAMIPTYLCFYVDRDLYNEELFWEFKQDFAGWKRTHLDEAGILKKDLKRVLMERGVFVPLKVYSDAIALEMVVSDDEPHIWTKEEIAAALKRKVNYRPKIAILEDRSIRYTPVKREGSRSQYQTQKNTQLQFEQPVEFSKYPSNKQQGLLLPYKSRESQSSLYTPHEALEEKRSNSFWEVPPVPVQTENLDPGTIVKFERCFDNKKK